MRPAKVLIVKTADGKDLQTNFRRKKRGYQKNRPPASETMTTFQKANRNKAKKQKKSQECHPSLTKIGNSQITIWVAG